MGDVEVDEYLEGGRRVIVVGIVLIVIYEEP